MLQIDRDLERTFPMNANFSKEGACYPKLRNVLIAFANYDKQVDYVQGINFIAGSLLYHCSEPLAFWLFVGLVEGCELRDLFLPSFPGLSKHSQILEILIMGNIPTLF